MQWEKKIFERPQHDPPSEEEMRSFCIRQMERFVARLRSRDAGDNLTYYGRLVYETRQNVYLREAWGGVLREMATEDIVDSALYLHIKKNALWNGKKLKIKLPDASTLYDNMQPVLREEITRAIGLRAANYTSAYDVARQESRSRYR